MLFEFIVWTLNSSPEEKAVVHCSAGIGRTGTTIALLDAIVNLSAQRNAGKEPQISIFDSVRRLKEQRHGAVQTKAQYKFLYEFIGDWIKKDKKDEL